MTFWAVYGAGLGVILLCMVALWLLSLALEDSSIVDIFWGSGFVIVGWVYFMLGGGYAPRQWLLMIMVTIWGVRLTLHLANRNVGEPEDYRYQNWREQHGQSWWWVSFFRVFVLQGMIMWGVSLPLVAAQYFATPATLTWLDYLAVPLWGIGFFFEAVGDWQLQRFKAQSSNDNDLLDSGLWRYTRHPNYFGDAVQWWAFYLPALAVGAWWAILSPAVMTFFLMRISGVAMLEKKLKHSKPKYADYMRRTSAFFPLPPKDN